jgi:hypothetical protein
MVWCFLIRFEWGESSTWCQKGGWGTALAAGQVALARGVRAAREAWTRLSECVLARCRNARWKPVPSERHRLSASYLLLPLIHPVRDVLVFEESTLYILHQLPALYTLTPVPLLVRVTFQLDLYDSNLSFGHTHVCRADLGPYIKTVNCVM